LIDAGADAISQARDTVRKDQAEARQAEAKAKAAEAKAKAAKAAACESQQRLDTLLADDNGVGELEEQVKRLKTEKEAASKKAMATARAVEP
jgi:hypothetical protein